MKIVDARVGDESRCEKALFVDDWIGVAENELHAWVSSMAVAATSTRLCGIMLGVK